MKEKLMALGSKRLGIAVVAGVVVIAVLTNPVTMVCTTVVACTYIVCETCRKSG